MFPKNFIVECNEAARLCSNKEHREALQLAAARLHTALETLYADRTTAAMQDLNSAWTRAAKALAALPPEGSPSPLGGDTFPSLLQNVA